MNTSQNQVAIEQFITLSNSATFAGGAVTVGAVG
jgi:hypothetical protein